MQHMSFSMHRLRDTLISLTIDIIKFFILCAVFFFTLALSLSLRSLNELLIFYLESNQIRQPIIQYCSRHFLVAAPNVYSPR